MLKCFRKHFSKLDIYFSFCLRLNYHIRKDYESLTPVINYSSNTSPDVATQKYSLNMLFQKVLQENYYGGAFYWRLLDGEISASSLAEDMAFGKCWLWMISLTGTAWRVFKYRVICSPYFSVFRLNTEIYDVNLRIQCKYRKMRARSNSVFGHFSHSVGIMTITTVNFVDVKKNEESREDSTSFVKENYKSNFYVEY